MNESTTNERMQFSRRRALAGALGAGLAVTLGGTLVLAQEGTPEPETDTTVTPETDETAEDEFADILQEVNDVLAAVQADRDAVATTVDVSVVDQLLAQATGLRDRAQTAASGADDALTLRLARAAAATARAAGDLIEAQLAAYGLPSQQTRASEVLAAAYETITAVGTDVASATDADVAAAVAIAQQLYQSAYDQYGAGTYAQAAKTAQVAARMARVGAVLAGSSEGGRVGGGFGGDDDRDRGGSRGGGRDLDRDDDAESTEEPVEVPAPTF